MARDISTFPQSLRSAAAVDDLSRALYTSLQHYTGEPILEWDRVPYHRRSGFFELALRTLRGLSDSPEQTRDHDPLFALATDLARAEASRVNYATVLRRYDEAARANYATALRRSDNVIGMIAPVEGDAA